MKIKYKQINIRNTIHSKFSEFCKNQHISQKEATENLILYAVKHQLDLNKINENAASSAKELIDNVGNKVQNLQNIYVSFQRTFESEHNYLQLLNIVMTFQNKKFEFEEDAINFKKAFFEQSILIRITTHPQQKLINEAGGTRVFFDIQLKDLVTERENRVSKMAIFEIIEVANKLVNEVILSIQNKKVK